MIQNKEILNLIFDFLWYRDIVICQLVSKLWNATINNKNYQFKRILCDQLVNFFVKNEFLKNYKVKLDLSINYKDSLFYLINLPNNINFKKLPINSNDLISVSNNKISFTGNLEGGDRIVYLNNFLPKCTSTYPAPFIFPIKKNNHYQIRLSNIYYFEITVDKKNFRKSWQDECIGIGFCSNFNMINYGNVGWQIGWMDDTFGFHSDDGNIYTDNVPSKYSSSWGAGDTIGAGIYFHKKYFSIFYTKNGKFLGFAFTNKLNSNYELIPAISIDSSKGVKINFGQNKFKFNIENMIIDHLKLRKDLLPMNDYVNINFKTNFNQIDYQDETTIINELITNDIFNNYLSSLFNLI